LSLDVFNCRQPVSVVHWQITGIDVFKTVVVKSGVFFIPVFTNILLRLIFKKKSMRLRFLLFIIPITLLTPIHIAKQLEPQI